MQTELTSQQKLNIIYRHTHRDYRGSGRGDQRAILVFRNGTCLVNLDHLTDAEIADKLPYSLKMEAERLAKKNAKNA